jgi:hypothetical protein
MEWNLHIRSASRRFWIARANLRFVYCRQRVARTQLILAKNPRRNAADSSAQALTLSQDGNIGPKLYDGPQALLD